MSRAHAQPMFKQMAGGLLALIAVLAIIGGIIWGCFWIAKKTSYFFFYESFVQNTVREMVKKEALK